MKFKIFIFLFFCSLWTQAQEATNDFGEGKNINPAQNAQTNQNIQDQSQSPQTQGAQTQGTSIQNTEKQSQGTSSVSTSEIADRNRRTTNFEWTPVPKAKLYEIEITPVGRTDGQNSSYTFTVSEAKWDGVLKPGKYTMRLRSRDKRNVPGEWSPAEPFQVKLYTPKIISPLPKAEIQSDQNETHSLTLKWEPQSEASLYKIHLEDDQKSFSQDLETDKNEITVKVPVSRHYSWTIIGFDKQGNEGDPMKDSNPFLIIGKQLTTPKIIPPETPFVRELKWEKSNYADKYTFTFYRRDKEKNRKWSKFNEGETPRNFLKFPTEWKGGEYKLAVTAYAPLRTPSKTHTITFDVANGFRSVVAEKRATLRKSIVRTNEWYFVASYFITQIQYYSENGDQQSKASFSAIGGTGRLGAGYFSSNTPYGFLGIVDYSGFTIGGSTYKYPSAEAHGTFRLHSESLGEVRVSGGLYLKQLPEILGQSVDSYQMKSIDTLGVHAGGEYWYPLTSKLGVQINGRIYYPMSGKTPTSGKLNSTPSLQFGFLGSLRLNEKATGLMGYAFRKDQISYKVTNSTSLSDGFTTNTSSVLGHYLNFLLEWDI